MLDNRLQNFLVQNVNVIDKSLRRFIKHMVDEIEMGRRVPDINSCIEENFIFLLNVMDF